VRRGAGIPAERRGVRAGGLRRLPHGKSAKGGRAETAPPCRQAPLPWERHRKRYVGRDAPAGGASAKAGAIDVRNGLRPLASPWFLGSLKRFRFLIGTAQYVGKVSRLSER